MNRGGYWLYLVRQAFSKRHLLALISFAFPPLLLTYGTLFEHTLTKTQDVPAWQTMILWGIVISQMLINGLCFACFKRMRLSVLALAALQGWLTLFPFIVAVMSVSGTWL